MRPPWLHDHIRKVTLSQKNKMSETARAVGRERTTSIMEYIGFRPSWSSNVELILRWDVCVVIMKDIIYKCYRAESGTLRFPAGRQSQCVIIIMSMAKPAGRAGYLMNLSQHGVGEDDEGDEADRPPPQDRPTKPPAILSVLNQYDKMASWPLVSTLYVRLR